MIYLWSDSKRDLGNKLLLFEKIYICFFQSNLGVLKIFWAEKTETAESMSPIFNQNNHREPNNQVTSSDSIPGNFDWMPLFKLESLKKKL